MKKIMMMMCVVLVAVCAFAEPTVTDVKARQRYPWNGKVDISYTVENAGTESRELSVWAVDLSTGVTNVAKAVTGETAYASGEHKIVWDMAADGLTLVSTNVVFAVSYKEKTDGLYCVIDLSGGTSASSYPVSYYDDLPSGGWSDEHKTSKLVFRKISAGTFTMGSPTGELGRQSNETQHQVMLTKDYYMGVFPVTQRQWELVMETRPSWFNNNTYYAPRPVERVSYNMIRGSSAGAGWPNSSAVDATSFLGVLRAKSGLALDLPTEAQWEYACRAGTTTALNSGKNLSSTGQDAEMDKVGRYWYNGGSSYSQSCDWSAGTAKVGTYAPNAWGLYDMHGNVWEWCLDWYGSYSGDVTDPKGSSSGSARVVRGGSWHDYANDCRSASRLLNDPSYEYVNRGFRLVRTLSNTAAAETAARSEAVAATSGGASVQGESDPVRVDLRTGTRTAAETETITYSTEWDNEVKVRGEGGDADAVAVVSVNGEVLSEQSGSGTIEWTPPKNGTYELTHKVMAGGVPVGEALTAAFLVKDLPDPPKPEGGPYKETVDGVEWTFMVDANLNASVGTSSGGAIPSSTAGDIVIPSKLGGRTVTRVGHWAFSGCNRLTRITVPNGVKSIGNYAFSECISLTNVVLPSSVTSIGAWAFSNCLALETFLIPAGVQNIEDGTFCACRELVELVIPEGVTNIGMSAFIGCKGLTSMTIPLNVVSIGEDAFYNCSALLAINVDEGNTNYSSHDGVLFNLSGTEIVAFPGGKTGTYVIPSTVTHIGKKSFRFCREFTGVIIPDGVVSIGEYAFAECYGLTSMKIPSSVTTIGYYAFGESRNLDKVDFVGAPPEGIADAKIKTDAAIRYNVKYEEQWLPVIQQCGWTNATPYNPTEPIEPGGEIVVPEGKAEAKAEEINNNPAVKAQYLKAPGGIETTAQYRECFDAVATSGSTVAFVLNEEGTNQVVEATTAAKTNTLESVLSKTGTLVIGDPLIGFYYSLKQGSDVTVGDKADLNKLAGRDELSFPLTTDKPQYFYQSLVTPTPVPEK